MGRLGADAFAEQVEEGNASLRTALSWHLTSNHYPPLPTFFIPVAERAIELGQDEEWDELIDLPRFCVKHQQIVETDDDGNTVHPRDAEGRQAVLGEDCALESVVDWNGRDDGKVRAGDVIESFHLDSFL